MLEKDYFLIFNYLIKKDLGVSIKNITIKPWVSIKNLKELNLSDKNLKKFMANYYHVRINTKIPKEDYARFKHLLQLKKEAIWDKDTRNKIKIGDYIGFIVNEKDPMVEIYKVIGETVRETIWKQNVPYVSGNGTQAVKHRVGIILINIHESIEWKKIKKDINFAPNNPSWMPRGMQIVKNKHLLPFEI